MTENNGGMERHWYDGGPYARFVDPMAGGSFAGPVGRLIEEGTRAVDIGCGPGTLALALARRCRHVTGIDASEGMIRFAEKQAEKTGCANVNFLRLPAEALPGPLPRDYDYAVMTQFLHEVPEETRRTVMEAAREMAKAVIIADFIAPFPGCITGAFMRLVEFTAGIKHNRCFKDWLARGGLDGFLERQKLRAIETIPYKTGVGKIIKISLR